MEAIELPTERLLLRPFRAEDADDVLAYAADEQWSHFLWHIPRPYARENAEGMVAGAIETNWDAYPIFALVFQGHVIGRISADIDGHTQVAELGWGIARAHWGQGIAREAVSALIDFLFQSHGLARVFARADAGNERSWRLMERLGMQHEGILRSHRVGRTGRSDEIFYGLLRKEWRPG